MTEVKTHHRILLALSVSLGIWGILLFFQSTYFSAPAFGLQPPSWSTWVGAFQLWQLNVIDTLALVVFVLILLLPWMWKRRRGAPKGRRAAGTASSVLGWVLLLAFLATVSYVVFHFTFSNLVTALRGFFGV